MPMGSIFEDNIILQINGFCPHDQNLFVLRHKREAVQNVDNCVVDPTSFSVAYINQHYHEYHHIILHSLYLSPSEIVELTDEAAKKIIWCVWGHDLYDNTIRDPLSWRKFVSESIHCIKKVLRGTYLRMYKMNQQVKRKVSLFHCIAIGYFYDELMIRKKYGNAVPVCIAPYFSDFTMDDLLKLREKRQRNRGSTTNILIGHSGFKFLEHEKYLELLRRYASEDIHINLVLTYGASSERIEKLTQMAESYFGREKCTILTEMMPLREYYDFLSRMDIAIFGYKHQSALANTKVMAFTGTKMYFDPDGVLAKGFLQGGVQTFDCHEIGKVSFSELSKNDHPVDVNAPLFDTYYYEKNMTAWQSLLS